MSKATGIWAILPIKSLHCAKQRLRKLLTAEQRRSLMLSSTEDVLKALNKSEQLYGILLISKDSAALALGHEYGAEVLVPTSDEGQSDAINRAVEFLRARDVAATITIPGDAPLLTADDIDSVCATLQSRPSLTLVSNLDGTGSNCIAASPPDLIRYQFGHDSFTRHQSAARDAGVALAVLNLPRLELDIDTEADIEALLRHRPRTATQHFLLAAGFGAGR